MDVFPRPRLWISGLQLLDRTIFKISGSSNHTVFPWITGKLDDSIWSFIAGKIVEVKMLEMVHYPLVNLQKTMENHHF